MSTVQIQAEEQIRKDRMGYWRGDLLVTPLVTEEILAKAYLRFKEEGLLRVIYHEGEPSMSRYLQIMEKWNVLACLRVPQAKEGKFEGSTCYGLAWTNEVVEVAGTFKKAEGGQGFFRHTPPRDTLWFGRMALEYVFEDLGVDAFFGTTPETNRASVRYAKALGFQVHGPIASYTTSINRETGQKEPCGVYVSVMTREQWQAGREAYGRE